MHPAPMVDSHCHLDYVREPDSIAHVLDRAREAGVEWFVTIGAGDGTESAPRCVALAHAHSDVLATVGIHPHDATLATPDALEEIERLAHDPRVVAIGEIGLDFHYEHSPRDVQVERFREQIAIAKRLGKPIVIHTRSARDETLAVLREEGARDVGGVIHCFSEDRDFAMAALDLDFDVSFSGIVTFKKSEAIRDAARAVPLDRMMIETDAPYLAPVPLRGRTNEPAYIAHTAAFLAQTLGIAERDLRIQTGENAIRRFGLGRFSSGF